MIAAAATAYCRFGLALRTTDRIIERLSAKIFPNDSFSSLYPSTISGSAAKQLLS